ncbi:MAG: phosphoadenosine phosphosulfate reductase family protein [Bacteroidetes bacterium]|nr:phosphoadenosine phosphosulfate reductase family protein [Bacteroidota bacterium]
MQRVINFSGGKSSALMALIEYKPGDIVLFTDTTREHPATYKFINDFEKYEKIPVTRVTYPGGWEGMLQNEGYGTVPNLVMRYCTKHLKIKTARKYLLSIGITECENLIGFRHDEQSRILNYDARWKKYKAFFPLDQRKITKENVNNFWSQKKYNLEIPHILGNCDLCFLKGQNAIISILKSFPELADKWIKDEKEAGGTYFKNISYEQLKNIAVNNLFKDYDLKNITPAFNCSCHS